MSGRLKEMIYLVIILIITLAAFHCLCGCAVLEQIGNAVNPQPEQIIPTVPKAQMWETIKGLTPNWLAIPVIALGAVAMLNGAARLGWSCIVFGSVNLFMALATSRFGFWMALCGLIGSMAAVAASIVAKNKAVKELIFGIQDSKGNFGHQWSNRKDAVNESQTKNQSKTTKKIVQQIKTKAKLKGEI